MSGPDHHDLARNCAWLSWVRASARASRVQDARQQRLKRGWRHGIAAKVFRLDDTEQGAPKVNDQQLGLTGGPGADDLAAHGSQRGRLSALVVAENQQVRVLLEIDCHRL